MTEATEPALGEPETTETSGGSRRKFPRVDMSTQLIGRVGGKQYDLPLANLSYGGAFFSDPTRRPVGELLELDLMQGEDTATTRARVVHSTDEGFAVAFVDPSILFTSALSRLLTRRLMESSGYAADGYDIAGRIAMLLQQGPEFEVLFTTSLGKDGVLVLTDRLWAYTETLWITVLEHGMFDCEVRVLWCTDDAMALEFLNPSDEFQVAYKRVLDAFLG